MMNPMEATKSLDEAIKLHMAHMNGTEPTSPGSQEKLMVLMKRAREALGSGPMSEKSQMPTGRRHREQSGFGQRRALTR